MRNMGTTERLIEGLPNDTQKLLQTYVKEVKGVFGEQLEGMLLYGSAVRGEFLQGRSNLNILLLVSSYDSAVLKQYSALHRRWSKEQIMVPLFLTEEELRMSAAVFPLEFLEIQEQHRVLGGRDPFIGFHVKTDRLREAVVQGLTSQCLTAAPALCRRGRRRRSHDDFVAALDHLDRSIAARGPTSSWASATLSLRCGNLGRCRAAEIGSAGIAGRLVAQARTDFSRSPRSASSL